MPTESKIRLLLADDHEMVRGGVRALLDGTEIKIVAEATTIPVAVKRALESDVDVILLDVRMPGGDGLTALGRIKLDKPDLPIILFSAFDNASSVAKAIALGASAFLLKGCSRDELLHAIRASVQGENVWTKETLRLAGRSLRLPRAGGSLEASLNENEGEVLRQMALGSTNKQIAVEMKITYVMVLEHVKHVLRKIGVSDRTQAAVWAVRNDLV